MVKHCLTGIILLTVTGCSIPLDVVLTKEIALIKNSEQKILYEAVRSEPVWSYKISDEEALSLTKGYTPATIDKMGTNLKEGIFRKIRPDIIDDWLTRVKKKCAVIRKGKR